MQAILLEEVEGLGEAGTVVTVARGYMRNYLLPRGMAEEATPARIAEVRSGESVLRWPTTRRGPTSYAGRALRVVPPPAAGGGSVGGGSVTGSARSRPASRPGVPE